MAKKRLAKKQRHSPLTRTKWWLRRRWQWFLSLKWWQKVLLIGGPLLVIAFVIPLIIYAYFALTMGDMEYLMNRNNTGVVLMDKSGEVFYSTGTAEHRELVLLDQIADSTEQALIASEDRNFYEHGGVSILSTLRAVYGYVLSGGGEFGGSTLTQQLAKMTLLSNDRGFLRQYQTFSVAMAIEQRYSKDEILTMYLNTVFFGNNSFGIEQAAKNYFDKEPSELTLAESAMLIGVLPAPSTYSPVTGNRELAVERQQEVLRRMVREGMITEAERTAAIEEEIAYQAPATIRNSAPHFTEMVLAELYEQYGEEVVERSGYQVTTTLDLGLQRAANSNVAAQRSYIESRGGSNAGLIAIDPKSGEIRALVGSVDYGNEDWGAVNMATTKRQPGSSFKPIYFAGALADGVITPATIIRDEPININGYAPQNATRQFYGDVTVRQALARSLNIPAVKVMQKYGVSRAIETARELGISAINDDASTHGLSLAIGSAEAPLNQITNAYAAFANAGQQYDTTTVHSIKDKFNKDIYTNDNTPRQVISAGGSYLISSILSDQNARSFMFGGSLNVNGRTVAVKTGTTDDNRDAWTVGYTPNIAIGVWVGNNDNQAMQSGGSDMAGPIWRETMAYATRGGDSTFNRPSSVVERNVCYGNGGLANSQGTNTYAEVFLATALPNATCTAAVERPREERPPEPEPTPEEPATDPDDTTELPEPEEPAEPTEPAEPAEPGAPTTPGNNPANPGNPNNPTTP